MTACGDGSTGKRFICRGRRTKKVVDKSHSESEGLLEGLPKVAKVLPLRLHATSGREGCLGVAPHGHMSWVCASSGKALLGSKLSWLELGRFRQHCSKQTCEPDHKKTHGDIAVDVDLVWTVTLVRYGIIASC